MFGLRVPELLVILVVVVLMFGSKKLPELGDSLGKGIRAFKKAAEHGIDHDDVRAEPKARSQLAQGSATTTPASAESEKAKTNDGGPA